MECVVSPPHIAIFPLLKYTPSMDSFSVTPQKVFLDRLKFAAQGRVPEQVLTSAQVYEHMDIMLRQMVYTLEVELLAEKLVSEDIAVETVLQEPLTWRDRRKLDVWYTNLPSDVIMRWIERHWPVRYRERKVTVTVRFDRYAKYPASALRIPELGTPVILECWGEPRWLVGD